MPVIELVSETIGNNVRLTMPDAVDGFRYIHERASDPAEPFASETSQQAAENPSLRLESSENAAQSRFFRSGIKVPL